MKQKTMIHHYVLGDLKKLVQQNHIRVVSFDLFDTLLVRPSMRPTDIFYLLKNKAYKEYGVDFVKLRINAEQEMKYEYATLEEIWNWIGKKNELGLDVICALMNLEMELESRLLIVREEVLSILREAKNAGKRVIITSDMYMSSEALMRILKDKGIEEIDKIYVSCEFHARKSEGRLFKLVAQQENIEDFSQIVHIGDSFASDYVAAVKEGITAVYYPSIWEDAYGKGRPWEGILGEEVTQDPYTRLLLSYAIFYTYLKRGRRIDEERCFTNLGDISSLYLGNVLLAISLDLLYNPLIRAKYDRISFAARDGYLPKRIYDILATGEKALPSHYFEASRQALSYTTYKDFFDYFDHIQWKSVFQKYILENYVRLVIIDRNLAEEILSSMTEDEKMIDLSCQMIQARCVLSRFKRKLNKYFYLQKKLAKAYYHEQFPEEGKGYLVFDCGYSGSVSLGLRGACSDSNNRFDKYYIWQTSVNQERDRKNGTTTYCLSPSDNFSGINLILEECFSPTVGACIGFACNEKQIVGVHEPMKPDEIMVKELDGIRNTCESYVRDFKTLFGPYMDCFILTDQDAITRLGGEALLKSPYMEISLFKSIRFTDTLNGGIPIELSKKVYDGFNITGKYQNVFHGTQFYNPDSYVVPTRKTNSKLRIGIHLHIHYLHVLEECICYLKSFPVAFDLIVTTTRPQSTGAIEMLSTALLSNMRRVRVIAVENRGRDVAPWLVATRPFQKDYDLFCHLHGKASVEYDDGIGTEWRRYLLNNLIACDAVADIISLFEENADIGCVFPEYYSYIKKICMSCGIPLIGEFNEQMIIEKLMQKMHIERTFSRDDMLYSCGTMLWYRPEALQPLFDLALTSESFPEEPVPNGGTIAHAIERMPGLVCAAQGFRAVIFNEVLEGKTYIPEETSAVGVVHGNQGKRSWKGHSMRWYIKKAVKSIVPYGAIRIWQRMRYKF